MSKSRQRAQAHYEMRRETIRLHHARRWYEQAATSIERKSARRTRWIVVSHLTVAAVVVAAAKAFF